MHLLYIFNCCNDREIECLIWMYILLIFFWFYIYQSISTTLNVVVLILNMKLNYEGFNYARISTKLKVRMIKANLDLEHGLYYNFVGPIASS